MLDKADEVLDGADNCDASGASLVIHLILKELDFSLAICKGVEVEACEDVLHVGHINLVDVFLDEGEELSAKGVDGGVNEGFVASSELAVDKMDLLLDLIRDIKEMQGKDVKGIGHILVELMECM